MDLPPVPCLQLASHSRHDCSFTHVAFREITALDHEVLDNTMEGRALIAEALLAGSEGTEVLSGLGDGLAVEANGDTAEFFIAVGDIEVDLLLLVHCDRMRSISECGWELWSHHAVLCLLN